MINRIKHLLEDLYYGAGRRERQELLRVKKARLTYLHTADLMQTVRANLAAHGVPVAENGIELIQGVFQETMHFDGPVAFAHIDCDWYDSVMTCAQAVAPRLSVGGKMVFDDYFMWSGCRKAVDEYFGKRLSQYRMNVVGKKMHVTRTASV